MEFRRNGLRLAVCAGLVLTAITAQAATFVIESDDNGADVLPGDGICANIFGECSFRAAVGETNALPGTDRIEVPGGNYLLSTLSIHDGLHFVGTGSVAAVIDGGLGHLFDVDSGHLTIENISSRDGQGFVGASGSSSVTVRGCTVEGHNAGFPGGAIYCSAENGSPSIDIIDSTFTGNSGGAISCEGPISIHNSTFQANTAFNVGGAINAGSSLVARFSRFVANSAGNVGGAIHAEGAVDVGWSEFTANSAGNVGAAIGSSGPTTVQGCTFDGNIAGNTGGGLHLHASSSVTNSTFVGNAARGTGGAIKSDSTLELSHITVTNSSATCFTDPNCSTTLNGGAVQSESTVHIGNSILYDNQETDCEGGNWVSSGFNIIGSTNGCTFHSSGTDLIGVDPLLGPLADNGGATLTREPLAGSPAIDLATDGCPGADQRMISRPRGPACDSGAVEVFACDFDGVVEPGEQCDDGNHESGDGCTATCEVELLSGRSLRLQASPSSSSKVIVNSKDARVGMGWGNFSADDPTLHGATVRIVSASGEFDDIYDLPAEGWRYIGKAGANRGYKYGASGEPIELVQIKPGRQLKIKGKGPALGHSLASDPGAVHWILELGDRMYCGEFGGTTRYIANKSFSAKLAPAPAGMPRF